jgi:hypothetical protein
MVHVWTSIGQPLPDGKADADILTFRMELDPEESALLGTDSTKIAAKLIAAQNYLTWLFSVQGAADQDYARTGMPKGSGPARPQGKSPRKPLDKVALADRAISVFQQQLERAKSGGDATAIKDAEEQLRLVKDRLANASK